MLDNLNSNFESSKAQRADANDDEVEIDLLGNILRTQEKNPSGTDGCSCRRLYCSSIYTVFDDTDLQLHIQYPCTFKRNHTDITGGSAV